MSVLVLRLGNLMQLNKGTWERKLIMETFTTEDERLVAGAALSDRPVCMGDIFESSWGYDQTNIDYYLVVGLTSSGKSVRVVKIGETVQHGGSGCDRVIPDPERVLGPPKLHRLQTDWRGQPSIKVRSWGVWASRWEGSSRYQTASGWGH